MASDRQQFHQSLEGWDQLHSAGAYSVPSENGITLILTPYNHAKHAAHERIETFDYFERQSLRLADHIMRSTGRAPELALGATDVDFKEALTNPSISDIILIGKGTLSSVEATAPRGRLTWLDLATANDHLKLGGFWQLVCGGMRKNLNVPLGTFVVSDHRAVRAPVHTYLRSRANIRRTYDHLQPITDKLRLTLPDVKQQFPYNNYYGRKDEVWAGIDRVERHLRARTLRSAARKRLLRLIGTADTAATAAQASK